MPLRDVAGLRRPDSAKVCGPEVPTGAGAALIGSRTMKRVRPGIQVDFQRAAVLLHDAIANVQAQPGAIPHVLRGEEGLENLAL